MGWKAGSPDKGDTEPSGESQESAERSTASAKKAGSKKSVILILAGLVVTGLVAGWEWVRRLPKD